MRFLYILLLYLLLPFVALHQAGRCLRDPAYRQRVGERFGYGRRLAGPTLWVHAVSVGEVQAAVPLVRALRREYPALPVVMTTVTTTGAARVQALFGDEVEHRYLPLDLPGSVARFFDRVRPCLAVVMETELWPNLFHACGRHRAPLVLASARLSVRSIGRYRRLARLFRETLRHGIIVGAQTAGDAERFRSIGAPAARTHVTGNLKLDIELPADLASRGSQLRALLGTGRPVWVAGSTHEGEEEAVLAAHRAVQAACPEALLVLVPRHPPRFEAVAALLRRQGVAHVTRSSGAPVEAATQVLLGDTLGELVLFYAAADVAFVGGTLVPVGGHNLLEPAALGRPVLAGPQVFNAPDIAAMLVEAGAAELVADGAALGARVASLLRDPAAARAIGQRGAATVAANRGALERLLVLLRPLLPPAGGGLSG